MYGLSDKMCAINDEIKAIEQRIEKKYAATYRQLKPGYDRYRTSRDKEKYLRGYESESILLEAAARKLKRLGAVPIPTTDKIDLELAALSQQK